MTNDCVKKKLYSILAKNYDVPSCYLSEKYECNSLLLEPYSMDFVLLAYLFYDIEKYFNITIPPEMLKNNTFSTIKGIGELIFNLSQ